MWILIFGVLPFLLISSSIGVPQYLDDTNSTAWTFVFDSSANDTSPTWTTANSSLAYGGTYQIGHWPTGVLKFRAMHIEQSPDDADSVHIIWFDWPKHHTRVPINSTDSKVFNYLLLKADGFDPGKDTYISFGRPRWVGIDYAIVDGSTSKSVDSAAIIGGIIGGVGFLAAVVVLVLWIKRYRRQKHQDPELSRPCTHDEDSTPPSYSLAMTTRAQQPGPPFSDDGCTHMTVSSTILPNNLATSASGEETSDGNELSKPLLYLLPITTEQETLTANPKPLIILILPPLVWYQVSAMVELPLPMLHWHHLKQNSEISEDKKLKLKSERFEAEKDYHQRIDILWLSINCIRLQEPLRMLQLACNIRVLMIYMKGDFTLPETLNLPRLQRIVSGDLSLGDTPWPHLPRRIAMQLTHITYVIIPRQGAILPERLLNEKLDSLTHFLLAFDESTTSSSRELQVLFRGIRDGVVPLLPRQLRVFIVQTEFTPVAKDFDEDVLNVLSGNVDPRVVAAPVKKKIESRRPDPLFMFYDRERAREMVHIYEADAKGFWIAAEEFISKRDKRIQRD
ncbi:hypothetical protein DL96DRAFT_1564985 [Flagelloscypha sp. PMI_526]|nr:hypothetical protein DL96DRAFT_1564985 [Flagelloscypha sp. PMI_526]